MSVEEMRDMFSEEMKNISRVIDDKLKFKLKLNIGDEAYKYLSTAKNMKSFFEVAGTGAAAGGIATIGWFSSLGVIGKIGLGLGMVTTPWGWIAAAGAGGAALTYGMKKMFQKADDSAMDHIPKFLNTPLDVLGCTVSDLILPPAIDIAFSDNNFCDNEKQCIINYFTDEWGFNKDFVEKRIKALSENPGINLIDFKNQLETLCENSNELKFPTVKKEILTILNEVVEADGNIEMKEFKRLKEFESVL